LNPHPVYFREAVASVLGQTIAELELVIVEDPSSSSARKLLADITDPRLRLLSNPTRTSLVDQRNRAFAEARGELVAMLDADDIALPDRLEKQLAYLREHPEVAVLGTNLIVIDEHGRDIGVREYPGDHAAIVAAMARYNAIAQPSVMCRRDVVIDAGGYQYRDFPVNEDYELWSRLIARGVRFANHSESLVRYRLHAGGTKALMLRRMLRATLDIKRRFWREHMDSRARLRFYGEQMLLGLPASWVLKLFVTTQYIAGGRRA
jgi:glycosyltransferase involved in cell wall biosynthesis